eukprot:360557-Chlamydomonas_euryale.AAC.5
MRRPSLPPALLLALLPAHVLHPTLSMGGGRDCIAAAPRANHRIASTTPRRVACADLPVARPPAWRGQRGRREQQVEYNRDGLEVGSFSGRGSATAHRCRLRRATAHAPRTRGRGRGRSTGGAVPVPACALTAAATARGSRRRPASLTLGGLSSQHPEALIRTRVERVLRVRRMTAGATNTLCARVPPPRRLRRGASHRHQRHPEEHRRRCVLGRCFEG